MFFECLRTGNVLLRAGMMMGSFYLLQTCNAGVDCDTI